MTVKLILGERVWPARLDIPGIEELERVTGAGLWLIQQKLAAGHCTLEEVRNTVRLGLAGAGASQQDALEAALAFVVPGRLEARRADAILVVDDALEAGEEEIAAYEVAGGKPPAPGPTGSGASRPSRPDG